MRHCQHVRPRMSRRSCIRAVHSAAMVRLCREVCAYVNKDTILTSSVHRSTHSYRTQDYRPVRESVPTFPQPWVNTALAPQYIAGHQTVAWPRLPLHSWAPHCSNANSVCQNIIFKPAYLWRLQHSVRRNALESAAFAHSNTRLGSQPAS